MGKKNLFIILLCLLFSSLLYAAESTYYDRNKTRLKKEMKEALRYALKGEVPAGLGPDVDYGMKVNEQRYGPSGYVLYVDMDEDGKKEKVIPYKTEVADDKERHELRVAVISGNRKRNDIIHTQTAYWSPLIEVNKLFKDKKPVVFVLSNCLGSMGGSGTHNALCFAGLDTAQKTMFDSSGGGYLAGGWDVFFHQFDKTVPCINIVTYAGGLEKWSVKTIFITCDNMVPKPDQAGLNQLIRIAKEKNNGPADGNLYSVLTFCPVTEKKDTKFSWSE